MEVISGVVKLKGELKYETTNYTVYEIDNKDTRIYAVATYDKYIEDGDKVSFDKVETIIPTAGKFQKVELYVIGEDCEVLFDDSDEAVKKICQNQYKSSYEDYFTDLVIESKENGSNTLAEYLYEISEKKTGEEKIFRWWLTNRILRRLCHIYIRGDAIDKGKDYFKCEANELYDITIKDPLAALFIPIANAITLCARFEVSYTDLELKAAYIARAIYGDLMNGHSYSLIKDLENHWGSLTNYLDILRKKYSMVYNKLVIQNSYANKVESKLAKLLLELKSRPNRQLKASFSDSCNLDEVQRSIVQESIVRPLLIYTGPPGTGKSQVIKYTIDNLETNRLSHNVLCPTAKAAGRVRDLTAQKATALTIHMFIKSSAEAPDVIIWDECSMTSSFLVYEVLKRCPKASHVFLGDSQQLPPISWGNFFSQLITSGVFDVMHLSKKYRSAKEVYVRDDKNSLVETKDCLIKNGNIIELIRQYKSFVDQGVNINQICIITSKNIHVDAINLECQMLNRNPEFLIDKAGKKFAVGDKVMLKKNQYKIGLWNGDLGFITSIDRKHRSIVVEFKQKEQTFKLSNDAGHYSYHALKDQLTTNILTLAYCLTVYAAQGDEWPYVIVYAPSDVQIKLFNFLTINTALSRAQLKNVVIGNIDNLQRCIKIMPTRSRNLLISFLKDI